MKGFAFVILRKVQFHLIFHIFHKFLHFGNFWTIGISFVSLSFRSIYSLICPVLKIFFRYQACGPCLFCICLVVLSSFCVLHSSYTYVQGIQPVVFHCLNLFLLFLSVHIKGMVHMITMFTSIARIDIGEYKNPLNT